MTDRDMAAEILRKTRSESIVCCICHTENISTIRFDVEEDGWYYRAYCRKCAKRMNNYELDLMMQSERADRTD